MGECSRKDVVIKVTISTVTTTVNPRFQTEHGMEEPC